VPMRTDCKHYESRTYANGETVRKCDLDLAPEAPWRCPEDCPSFAPRLVDIGWTYGSLVSPPTPEEPPNLDEHAARLLDEAEDILNAAGPEILAELQKKQGKGRKGGQPRAGPRWPRSKRGRRGRA